MNKKQKKLTMARTKNIRRPSVGRKQLATKTARRQMATKSGYRGAGVRLKLPKTGARMKLIKFQRCPKGENKEALTWGCSRALYLNRLAKKRAR